MSRAAPKDPTTTAELARLERLANALDAQFRVPGLGWRFGWDSILGLVPGVGDAVTLGPAAYMIWQGRNMGARRRTLGRMSVNTAIDFVIGGIPIAGDAFDAVFKANRRNLALLKADLDRMQARAAAADPDGIVTEFPRGRRNA